MLRNAQSTQTESRTPSGGDRASSDRDTERDRETLQRKTFQDLVCVFVPVRSVCVSVCVSCEDRHAAAAAVVVVLSAGRCCSDVFTRAAANVFRFRLDAAADVGSVCMLRFNTAGSEDPPVPLKNTFLKPLQNTLRTDQFY